MPELPEVESIKLQLIKYLRDHKVVGVAANYKNLEGNPKNLVGGKFKTTRRFGKVLAIDFSNDYSLLAHIKLTGQFIYRGPNLKNPKLSKKIVGGVPGRHTFFTLKLNKNGFLYYNDVRRFGWLRIVKTKDVIRDKFVEKLGPEPLAEKTKSPLPKLTKEKFTEILSKTRRGLKVLLMDQSKIGGVGNIYANDALWVARIHPERAANTLTESETKVLFAAIEEVLLRGLKYGGASELAFVTPDGSEGEYQNFTTAYGKVDVPCQRPECKRKKSKFAKKMVGGRGTYFCKNCQK